MTSEASSLPASPFASLVDDDIKQFILTHNLDESAREKLEALDPEQRADVVAQDSAGVRNMSAVVVSRANRCQREGAQFAGPACQEYVAGIVAKFIDMLSLDEKSAAGLRELAPRDQVAVMAKDMEGVTNPSGVVDSRVRKLLRGSTGSGRVAGFMGVAPNAFAAGPPSMAAPKDACQYLEQAYGAFVSQYGVDQRAQEQAAQLSPLERLEVISQGMENVYNPSGAVASRCSKVRERPVVLGPRAAQWVREVAELFCNSYGIDGTSDAFKLLQTLPVDKQFEVCSKDLAGARKPQSVLYCRIQKLSQEVAAEPAPVVRAPSPVVKVGNTAGNVEQFIAHYKLDDRAAHVLRELAGNDPAGAEEVMLQPITPEVRNPSGVIHARVTGRMGTPKRAAAVSVAPRSAPY